MAPIYIQIYFRMNSHFFSDENTLCVAIDASVDHRENIQRYGFSASYCGEAVFFCISGTLRLHQESSSFSRLPVPGAPENRDWRKESEGEKFFRLTVQ